mgnify:FL=1
MVGDPDFHAVKAGCGMVWYSMVCCWKEQNVGYGVGKIMCGGPEFRTRKKKQDVVWYMVLERAISEIWNQGRFK